MTYIGLKINISSQRYQLCDYITFAIGCSPYESCHSNLKTRTQNAIVEERATDWTRVCHPLYILIQMSTTDASFITHHQWEVRSLALSEIINPRHAHTASCFLVWRSLPISHGRSILLRWRGEVGRLRQTTCILCQCVCVAIGHTSHL